MDIGEELERVLAVMKIEPQSIDEIAKAAKIGTDEAMIVLTKLEIGNLVRETVPGYFVKIYEPA